MIKIRLTSLTAEVQAAAERLGQVLMVLETSKHYLRRGNSALVSLYLQMRITPGSSSSPAGPAVEPGPVGPVPAPPVPPVKNSPDEPAPIPLEVPKAGGGEKS